MASVLLVLMFYTLRSAPAQERGAA